MTIDAVRLNFVDYEGSQMKLPENFIQIKNFCPITGNAFSILLNRGVVLLRQAGDPHG